MGFSVSASQASVSDLAKRMVDAEIAIARLKRSAKDDGVYDAASSLAFFMSGGSEGSALSGLIPGQVLFGSSDGTVEQSSAWSVGAAAVGGLPGVEYKISSGAFDAGFFAGEYSDGLGNTALVTGIRSIIGTGGGSNGSLYIRTGTSWNPGGNGASASLIDAFHFDKYPLNSGYGDYYDNKISFRFGDSHLVSSTSGVDMDVGKTYNVGGVPHTHSEYAAGVAAASTGIIAFASPGLSINSDITKFDVAAVKAYFVTNANTLSPTVTTKEFSAVTGVSVPDILTQNVTYVGITVGGTITVSGSPFTPTQRRTIAPLGVVVHSNHSYINTTNNAPHIVVCPANQLGDLMGGIGPFNVSGNLFTAHGTDLSVDKSAGYIFKQGAGFIADNSNPNVPYLGLLTAPNTRYRTRTGAETSDSTSLDVAYWDNAGTRTLITGNRWSIQRIYVFQSNLVRCQYGQALYNTKELAIHGIISEQFETEKNLSENGLLRGLLIVQSNCTNLSDANHAYFIEASKFGGTTGLGSLSTTTLHQAYLNSTSPEIQLTIDKGPVTFRDYSAVPGEGLVFEIQDYLGNNRFTVAGNGDVDGLRYLSEGRRWAHDNHGWEVDDVGTYNHLATWTNATRTVAVPSGAARWDHGIRTVSAGESVVILNTSGMHFIKWDPAGVLQNGGTAWSILNDIPAMAVYWNDRLAEGIPIFEQHTQQRNLRWHNSAHFGIGTLQVPGGFSATGYTLNGTTDAANSFGIAAGYLIDEDITYPLSALTDGTITTLGDGGSYTIAYRDQVAGTRIGWKTVAGVPFSYTTYIEYNNVATGAFAAVSSGNYVCYYVVALQSIATKFQFLILAGQAQYTNLTLAQGESFSSLNLGDFANFTEYLPIYKIIYQRKSSGSQAGRASMASFEKIPGSRSSIAVTAGGDHQALSNRTAIEAHPLLSITTGGVGYIPFGDATGHATDAAFKYVSSVLYAPTIEASTKIQVIDVGGSASTQYNGVDINRTASGGVRNMFRNRDITSYVAVSLQNNNVSQNCTFGRMGESYMGAGYTEFNRPQAFYAYNSAGDVHFGAGSATGVFRLYTGGLNLANKHLTVSEIGVTTLHRLAGNGSRMVVADSTGALSATAYTKTAAFAGTSTRIPNSDGAGLVDSAFSPTVDGSGNVQVIGKLGVGKTAGTYPLEVAGTVWSVPASGSAQFYAKTPTATSLAGLVCENDIGRFFTVAQYGSTRGNPNIFGQANANRAVMFTDYTDIIIGAGSVGAASIFFGTNNTLALTIGTDQSATFAGAVTIGGTKYPTSIGAVGQVLTYSSAGVATWSNKTDETGSFTGTWTGMTTTVTGTIYWQKTGNLVSLFIPATSGTSNATTFTITGMDSGARPAAERRVLCMYSSYSEDQPGKVHVASTGTMTFYMESRGTPVYYSSSGFQNAGSKGTPAQVISYYVS